MSRLLKSCAAGMILVLALAAAPAALAGPGGEGANRGGTLAWGVFASLWQKVGGLWATPSEDASWSGGAESSKIEAVFQRAPQGVLGAPSAFEPRTKAGCEFEPLGCPKGDDNVVLPRARAGHTPHGK